MMMKTAILFEDICQLQETFPSKISTASVLIGDRTHFVGGQSNPLFFCLSGRIHFVGEIFYQRNPWVIWQGTFHQQICLMSCGHEGKSFKPKTFRVFFSVIFFLSFTANLSKKNLCKKTYT
jgi:hypothetical protein